VPASATCFMLTKPSGVIERPDYPSYTRHEAIQLGVLYAVDCKFAADWDTAATSPAEAALKVGSTCKGAGILIRDLVRVSKHLPGSRVGSGYLEDGGEFPTATHEFYDI